MNLRFPLVLAVPILAVACTDSSSEREDLPARGYVNVVAPVLERTGEITSHVMVTRGDGGCQESAFGACVIRTCPNATETAAADFGAIAIDSAAFRLDARFQDGKYGPAQASWPNDTRFQGGEPVTIAARGGALPGFTEVLAFPKLIVLEAPLESLDPADASQPFAVPRIVAPRDRDLSLSWSSGPPSVALFVQGQIHGAAGNLDDRFVQCELPAEAGRGEIPRALLEQVPAGTELRLYTVARRRLRHVQGLANVELRVGAEVAARGRSGPASLIVR